MLNRLELLTPPDLGHFAVVTDVLVLRCLRGVFCSEATCLDQLRVREVATLAQLSVHDGGDP